MRRAAIYGGLALIVAFFTVLLLAVVVEGLLRFPLVDIRMVKLQFSQDMSLLDGAGAGLLNQLRFYLYTLQKLWVLWLVPLTGVALFIAGLTRLKRSGEKRLLEHVYFLEQNLERVTKFEQAGRHALESYRISLFQAYEQAPEAFLVIGREGLIEHLNAAAMQLLARWNNRNEQFARRLLKDVIPGYGQTELAKMMYQLDSHQEAWFGEIELPQIKSWAEVKSFAVEEGRVLIFKETTHVHLSPEEQALGRNLLHQIITGAPNAFAVLDKQFRFVQASKGWVELFGDTAENSAGKPYEAVLPGFPPQWATFKQQLTAGRTIQQDDIRTGLNGQEAWLSLKVQPWQTDGGQTGGYIMFIQNRTNAKLAHQRLQQLEEQENKLAYNDSLTGLPNRQLFYDRLNMSLAMAYRQLNKVGLLFLDLDGFKAVNDTLGHEVGDMLLKAVAERLQHCVRQADTVSRLGGDEFTVITSVQDSHDCQLIAEKIISEINRPFDLGEHKGVHIGTSIGISLYPQDGTSANELVRRADMAMYVSKKGGKNSYHFFVPEMELQHEGEQKDDA